MQHNHYLKSVIGLTSNHHIGLGVLKTTEEDNLLNKSLGNKPER
jgi:hypothetical protein